MTSNFFKNIWVPDAWQDHVECSKCQSIQMHSVVPFGPGVIFICEACHDSEVCLD